MGKNDPAAVKVYICTDCTKIVAWPQTVKPPLSLQCTCFVPRHTEVAFRKRSLMT